MVEWAEKKLIEQDKYIILTTLIQASVLYKDGNGFPLTLKPSHMFGSTERMDVAEVMSAIVEQACLYVPETPVGEMLKRPNVKIPKEAHTDSEKSYPKEAFTRAENVFAASSDLVRFQ